MTGVHPSLSGILSHSPVRVVAGSGALDQLGSLVAECGAQRVLLVTDPGIERAGHVLRARASLQKAGRETTVFDGVAENPTTDHVAAGLAVAQRCEPTLIVGLGGGSALDCAKGINLLHTNGGVIHDYWGEDKAHQPMLPMIAVPTTAGTGSEGQSFALISDALAHQKMACGDRRPPTAGGLRPRAAILDPELTATLPRAVAVAAGIDALSHVIETAATTRRNEVSRAFTRAAWDRVRAALPVVLKNPNDAAARGDMLLGAHLAGCAIEHSMLGAAHACANPLTAKFGVVHGEAVGVMLPHVIRFNARLGNPYADLGDADTLANFVEEMLAAGGVERTLSRRGVSDADVLPLAEQAARQWTAQFNPRQVETPDLAEVYRRAL
jgi:alcohol dehydrogenase